MKTGPMMSPGLGKPVLAIGEALVDLIVNDGAPNLEVAGSLAIRPGGAPANCAVALARQGVSSAFCGVVGADPFGKRLLNSLRAEGVDTSRVRQTTEAETTLTLAWQDERGDGHFRLLTLADRLLDIPDIDAAGIDQLAALVVGSVALAAEPSGTAVQAAVGRAASAGVPVIFDVNIRPSIWPDPASMIAACDPVLRHTTLLKLSLDDAVALFDVPRDPDALLTQAATLPPSLVVLTDGARGAWSLRPDGTTIHIPAFAVDAVEPTGAGDAFTAGLISRLLASNWQPPTEADLRHAAAAGALATTKHGARDGLPTAAELAAFLERTLSPAPLRPKR